MFGEKNSVTEIFDAAAKGNRYSRSELSRLTGYSLMTVGKVIDALERGGLVVQQKYSSGSVGRNMNLCAVNDKCGILIYDFSRSKPQIFILDMRLNVKGEITSDNQDVASLMAEGFGGFLEFHGGELMGIGCIVNEGTEEEYSEEIRHVMGNSPELITTPKFASAAAHVCEILPNGTALFVRVCDDICDLVLWNNGFVSGAHNRASDGSFIRGRDDLINAVASFCMFVDPETVHITAKDGSEICSDIREILNEYGVSDNDLPKLIVSEKCVEPVSVMGAALMLRNRIVMENAEKYS